MRATLYSPDPKQNASLPMTQWGRQYFNSKHMDNSLRYFLNNVSSVGKRESTDRKHTSTTIFLNLTWALLIFSFNTSLSQSFMLMCEKVLEVNFTRDGRVKSKFYI